MEWKRIKPLKDTQQIAKFERLHQVVFPVDFVELIKKYNGACPSKPIFDTEQEREKVAVRLLSFNQEDQDTIWQTYAAIKTRLPAGMMPFMMDPFGNYLCFYHDPLEDEQEVVYWQHEKLEGNIQAITPNLTQFLAKLYAL